MVNKCIQALKESELDLADWDDDILREVSRIVLGSIGEPSSAVLLASGIPVHNAKLIWQDMLAAILKGE